MRIQSVWCLLGGPLPKRFVSESLKDPVFVAMAMWPKEYPEKHGAKFWPCARHLWIAQYWNQSQAEIHFFSNFDSAP